MKADQKQKALAQLALDQGAASLKVLNDEGRKIRRILEIEKQYDRLEEQLDLLDVFAFRIHDIAVSIVESLIHRLGKFKLTYSDSWGHRSLDAERYQNAATLTVKVIGTLTQLRYLETERVLTLLLNLSVNENSEIRKKATEGLQALANYELSVFYGPDRKGGIGSAPQQKIVQAIESLKDRDLRKYQSGIVTLAMGLLSPTMETTTATYKTVTLTNAAVPGLPEVKDIRRRTIAILKRLYALTSSVSGKTYIIGGLMSATSEHRSGEPGDEARQMVSQNAREVLQFFEGLVLKEDLPIVQKIEHEGYWMFRRMLDDEVRRSAQALEAKIAQNAEYQIYRNLIGFEGIFGKWSSLEARENRWNATERYRERKASQYARSITRQSYDEWRRRILHYVQTESDDLATFPVFFQFLREFAEVRPEIAIKLISTDAEQVQRFLIPLLRGLWASAAKANIRQTIENWIEQRRNLYQCTKMFMGNDDFDRELLSLILKTATEAGDRDILNLIVSVAISNYEDDKQFLLTDFIIPAVAQLTKHSDSRWIFDSWYRREFKAAIKALDEGGVELVLANLSHLKKVNYHADGTLAIIAHRFPTKVIDFFGSRLKGGSTNKHQGDSTIQAFPYQFRELKEPLSKIPAEAVKIVRGWFDGNDRTFIYTGARFLKNIFPDFSKDFQSELIEFVRKGDEESMMFVLAILRNYEGEVFLHPICKEIVHALPEDDSLLEDVMIALESTGVMTGEFGRAETYERKAKEVNDWLVDPDRKISAFARKYIEGLQSMSIAERKRAEEDIELRKYRFGE